ncbi:MAG: M24 family metallopeptidase [Pseudobdellovibrionaceae bacterium]
MQCTDRAISKIQPGMREVNIKDLIIAEFKSIGVEKFWHPTKIRIGSDTVKSFKELSDPEKILNSEDICFLDLGPVIADHEADYGKTFLVNSNKNSPMIDACHSVFESTAQAWKQKKLSGIELFNFASTLAKDYGYDLNPMMAGHRLGDFPHKLFSSQKLFELEASPNKNLWVLEIHIIDPSSQTGAFFEDILL